MIPQHNSTPITIRPVGEPSKHSFLEGLTHVVSSSGHYKNCLWPYLRAYNLIFYDQWQATKLKSAIFDLKSNGYTKLKILFPIFNFHNC